MFADGVGCLRIRNLSHTQVMVIVGSTSLYNFLIDAVSGASSDAVNDVMRCRNCSE